LEQRRLHIFVFREEEMRLPGLRRKEAEFPRISFHGAEGPFFHPSAVRLFWPLCFVGSS
jgi:hypothetical protein